MTGVPPARQCTLPTCEREAVDPTRDGDLCERHRPDSGRSSTDPGAEWTLPYRTTLPIRPGEPRRMQIRATGTARTLVCRRTTKLISRLPSPLCGPLNCSGAGSGGAAETRSRLRRVATATTPTPPPTRTPAGSGTSPRTTSTVRPSPWPKTTRDSTAGRSSSSTATRTSTSTATTSVVRRPARDTPRSSTF